MSRFKIHLAITLACLAFTSCRNDQREQQLAERERAIVQKEKDFALKEADYYSLVKFRDSILVKKDTMIIKSWPAAIAGLWSAKSVCRESNCSDYVIGDQRANQWEFISDSTGLFTRVTDNNNKLVRVYSARFDSTNVKLQFSSDSAATKKMDIHVDLGQATTDLLKGVQTIGIDKSCTAKFVVELTRTTKR